MADLEDIFEDVVESDNPVGKIFSFIGIGTSLLFACCIFSCFTGLFNNDEDNSSNNNSPPVETTTEDIEIIPHLLKARTISPNVSTRLQFIEQDNQIKQVRLMLPVEERAPSANATCFDQDLRVLLDQTSSDFQGNQIIVTEDYSNALAKSQEINQAWSRALESEVTCRLVLINDQEAASSLDVGSGPALIEKRENGISAREFTFSQNNLQTQEDIFDDYSSTPVPYPCSYLSEFALNKLKQDDLTLSTSDLRNCD